MVFPKNSIVARAARKIRRDFLDLIETPVRDDLVPPRSLMVLVGNEEEFTDVVLVLLRCLFLFVI